MIVSRERKILHISQAHIAPGISLVKWREILAAYAVFPDEAGTWRGVSDDQVDQVFNEIAGVVSITRKERLHDEC